MKERTQRTKPGDSTETQGKPGTSGDPGTIEMLEGLGEPAAKILADYVVEHVDVGDRVLCDSCGLEFSDLPDVGGILFQSKAICPRCAPRWLADTARHGEEKFIRARCPEGKAFAAWVREDLRTPAAKK